ncbi:MAG: glycosyltransferase family 2 protein [Candidatus Omnitrophota bacterium]|nr:glycosyltransferase family 2 protein [Candidatus Omnitrophota bacterium]
MSEPICDIVIPIWNQPELTAACLQSVAACTEIPARLILVDNGSEAPTCELLNRFKAEGKLPAEILRNPTNLGFIKAVNQGIRAGKAPWVCLLNNDTVVTTGWLSEMIRVAESDPGIGLVNPTSNCLGYPAKGRPPGEITRRLAENRGKSAPLSTAIGFCLLARRSLFDQIGLLDEQFGMGNFDDDDFSLRVRQAGLRPVRAAAAYVHHEEKASFKKLPGWEKAFDENRKKFEQKWGRRLRILWGPVVPASLSIDALAGAGHWISVIGPLNGKSGKKSDHAQVDYLPSTPGGWRSKALWRLVTKRKKPFDLVVSLDPAWSRWIRRLQLLHRAKLLENPTQNELLEQCRTLSRSQ